jgi:nucleotide-binding universal stress UspA family protein
MFRTIVVGTDGSPDAVAAVRTAGELAAGVGIDTVHIVTGYRPLSVAEWDEMASRLPDEFRYSIDLDLPGENRVAQARDILKEMGVKATPHLAATDGADAILNVAEEIDADLVVVGSRGLGLGSRVFHGSVSTKVAHHAPCSVLIVQHVDRGR